ncbi:MAG: DUF4164 domain-containing protein [Microcystaceae cyanobacterium]
MPPTIIETKLEDVLTKIDNRLERIENELINLKVSQTEIRGDIKTLDEKVTGLGKRLENQEFVNRGILTALIVALIAGAAKFLGLMPNS